MTPATELPPAKKHRRPQPYAAFQLNAMRMCGIAYLFYVLISTTARSARCSGCSSCRSCPRSSPPALVCRTGRSRRCAARWRSCSGAVVAEASATEQMVPIREQPPDRRWRHNHNLADDECALMCSAGKLQILSARSRAKTSTITTGRLPRAT